MTALEPDSTYGVRYHVEQSGRSGARAYVVDRRPGRNHVVLTIGGPDRFETAQRVADALNASRTETPAVS